MGLLERNDRSHAIKQIVAINDVARWIRHQLEDIRSVVPRPHERRVTIEPKPGPAPLLRT